MMGFKTIALVLVAIGLVMLFIDSIHWGLTILMWIVAIMLLGLAPEKPSSTIDHDDADYP